MYKGNQDEKQILEIRRVTWIGLSVNVFLSVVKFIFGALGHSQAVIADAIHSLSDLSTDITILFGVNLWSKPADAEHPYGHRRIETFATIFISLILFSVAAGIGYRALITISSSDRTQPGLIALVGALLSIIIKEVLYRWTLIVGKSVKSSAVIANAWHHRTDAFSSIPVALAVTAAALSSKWYFLDRIGAFVISVYIFAAAWKILRESLLEFLDVGACEKYRKQIKGIVLNIPQVQSMHGLRTRKVGSGWYLDMHIQVAPLLTVRQGHDISKTVKRVLLAKDLDVLDVVVHLEPYEKDI